MKNKTKNDKNMNKSPFNVELATKVLEFIKQNPNRYHNFETFIEFQEGIYVANLEVWTCIIGMGIEKQLYAMEKIKNDEEREAELRKFCKKYIFGWRKQAFKLLIDSKSEDNWYPYQDLIRCVIWSGNPLKSFERMIDHYSKW